MKRNYFNKLSLCAVLFLCFNLSQGQIQYRQMAGFFGTAILDVNDSGQAIKTGGVYDFATDTTTPIDPEAMQLSGINNYGDIIGSMPLLVGTDIYAQPAYKRDGVWHEIGFPAGADIPSAGFSISQISENGLYITGQMAPDSFDFQAFLYNTATGITERIADPANEYSATYTVNDAGIMGGWFDPPPMGTLRVPAYMTTGSVFTSILPALPTWNTNDVFSINNSNIMAGEADGKPFIYDMATAVLTEFNVPAGYQTAAFTSISENGIAVGYCQIMRDWGPDREAIIYHPSLGSQPILIKEILDANGFAVTTSDGKLGTAITISPNGNYVGGWGNGMQAFATGWIINFDDLLLSSCYMNCPDDITVTSLSGPKQVNYTLPVNCSSMPGATPVLVSGLDSGALFPLGTTQVVHYMVDGAGVIVNTCTFNVTVSDQYCLPPAFLYAAEAITRVNLAGINNSSILESTDSYEDFSSIEGNVVQGGTYLSICEGFTGGPYTDYFTAYIDWDHNGDFDPATEVYALGTISDSSGTDGQQALGSVTVPAAAIVGSTMMRIAKTYDLAAASACNPGTDYGQVEDYTLQVSEQLATVGFNSNHFRYFPNPTKDMLNVSNDTPISSVGIYNVIGQEVRHSEINMTAGKISLSNLAAGVYLAKVAIGTTVKTFKIIKE